MKKSILAWITKEQQEAWDAEDEKLWLQTKEEEESQRRYGRLSPANVNLRKFRIERGLNKQEIAAIMDVTPRAYFAYENGDRAIPSVALQNLAERAGCDVHQILLGRPAPSQHLAVKIAVGELRATIEFLESVYPNMDLPTRLKVACYLVVNEWENQPKMHPGTIHDAVRMTTRYRFFPEELPPPPNWEHYENEDAFEQDMAEWNKMAEEIVGSRDD